MPLGALPKTLRDRRKRRQECGGERGGRNTSYHFWTVIVLFRLLVLGEHVERRTEKVGRVQNVEER